MDDHEQLLLTIGRMEWIFAKTYAAFAPHWYTRRADADFADYRRLFDAIQRDGVDERFGLRLYRYLYLDGFKYWSMTSDFRMAAIINRAKVKAGA